LLNAGCEDHEQPGPTAENPAFARTGIFRKMADGLKPLKNTGAIDCFPAGLAASAASSCGHSKTPIPKRRDALLISDQVLGNAQFS
jgi:hypothetical protein